MTLLYNRFLHGEGVPKDLAVAKEWFQIAATQGYEPSQTKIQQITLLENNTALQEQQRQQHQRQQSSGSIASTTTEEKRSSRWSLGFFNNKKK